MSVICCFRFLGVVDSDLCPGFGVVINADRSSCGELTTTPFHNFTHPPFTSCPTFTASPSLKEDGQSGSDICRPLTSAMSCRRSSQTLPSYRLLSLPTHCTGIRSIRDDQMAMQTEKQVLVAVVAVVRYSSLALRTSAATASALPHLFSTASASALLSRRLSPSRSKARRRSSVG